MDLNFGFRSAYLVENLGDLCTMLSGFPIGSTRNWFDQFSQSALSQLSTDSSHQCKVSGISCHSH